MDEKRTLSEADVTAIVNQLESSVVQRFQLNIGRGVIALVWKWVITGCLLLAAYGAGGGFRKWGG